MRKDKKYLIPIVITLVVVLVLATIALVFLTIRNITHANIISITHKPENPLPGQDMTITAVVENSKECPIHFFSFFADGGWGRSAFMEKINDKTWEYKIDNRQFSNGTEIWVIVYAISYDDSFIVSDEDTIQIGNVQRSDITTLSISNIEYFPPIPTSEDTFILVNASVASNSTISKVEIGYTALYSYGWGFGSGSSGDSGSGIMTYQNDSIYEFYINTSTTLNGGYPTGMKVLFKIAAQDESGNTAVSQTISLIIA